MRKKDITQLIWLPTGGHIGDAVLIMALFAEVVEKSPELNILYVLRRNASFIAALTAAYPHITVVPLPYSLLRSLTTTLALLKKRSLVIVPPPRNTHPTVIKLLATLFFLRGDYVIGFRDKGIWQPYHISLQYNRDQKYIDNLRRALSYTSLPTASLGTAPHLHMAVSLPETFQYAKKDYMVIHPFPHMATFKTLPLHRWKKLINQLHQQYPTYGLVITGADVDRVQAEHLVDQDAPNIFLAIGLPILQLAGIIQQARLYIGVDTGPTHIAGVLCTPSVVLAQQNEPAWLPDYNPNATLIWEKKNCTCGVPGKPCGIWEEGNFYRRCVYDISDEIILQTVHKKLLHS